MPGGWNNVLRRNPVPGDVVACLQEMGVHVLKVDADEARAVCPAHAERTGKTNSRGDWSVNTDDGRHNCFSCGFKGEFVDIVMEVLSISREEAVSWTRERGGIERVRKVLGIGSEFVGDETDRVDESDLALFIDVPADVCESRNIWPDAADDYRVLWDDDREMWITCIREYESDLLIGWQEKNERHFNNHPPHMEKRDHLFGINDVPEDCRVGVLVESPLDCPYLLSAGVEGGVSSMGAGVSEAQLDILVSRFDTLVSALDNDKAGDQTNAELRRRVGGRANLRFWNYGQTDLKDPGEQSYDQVYESYRTSYNSILARW